MGNNKSLMRSKDSVCILADGDQMHEVGAILQCFLNTWQLQNYFNEKKFKFPKNPEKNLVNEISKLFIWMLIMRPEDYDQEDNKVYIGEITKVIMEELEEYDVGDPFHLTDALI